MGALVPSQTTAQPATRKGVHIRGFTNRLVGPPPTFCCLSTHPPLPSAGRPAWLEPISIVQRNLDGWMAFTSEVGFNVAYGHRNCGNTRLWQEQWGGPAPPDQRPVTLLALHTSAWVPWKDQREHGPMDLKRAREAEWQTPEHAPPTPLLVDLPRTDLPMQGVAWECPACGALQYAGRAPEVSTFISLPLLDQQFLIFRLTDDLRPVTRDPMLAVLPQPSPSSLDWRIMNLVSKVPLRPLLPGWNVTVSAQGLLPVFLATVPRLMNIPLEDLVRGESLWIHTRRRTEAQQATSSCYTWPQPQSETEKSDPHFVPGIAFMTPRVPALYCSEFNRLLDVLVLAHDVDALSSEDTTLTAADARLLHRLRTQSKAAPPVAASVRRAGESAALLFQSWADTDSPIFGTREGMSPGNTQDRQV